jgi:hypothetical protein
MLNVHIETITYVHIYIYIKYICIYSQRENKIILVSSSEEVWEVREIKKILENEKY